MDKQALRREIREKKRAMTDAQIESASCRLGELFFASEQYRNAKQFTVIFPITRKYEQFLCFSRH